MNINDDLSSIFMRFGSWLTLLLLVKARLENLAKLHDINMLFIGNWLGKCISNPMEVRGEDGVIINTAIYNRKDEIR